MALKQTQEESGVEVGCLEKRTEEKAKCNQLGVAAQDPNQRENLKALEANVVVGAA